jgi:P2-related tail formation protein
MDEYLKVWEPLFKKWFDDVDMSSIMVYMIDCVNIEALSFLAKQFNVYGNRGWDLATTEASKRELIKNAIQLQKKVGTPWSIKNALKAIGFNNVSIIENINTGNRYNGEYIHNGTIKYMGSGGLSSWVNFSVVIKVINAAAITAGEIESVRLLINEYKPARCVLVDLTFENI